jgi:hypothetical protein
VGVAVVAVATLRHVPSNAAEAEEAAPETDCFGRTRGCVPETASGDVKSAA